MFQSLYVISIAELIVNQIEQALKSIQSLKFDEATSLLTSIYDTISGKVSSLGSNEPDETSNECFILSEFINLLLDYTSFWALVVSEKYSDSWSKLQDVQSRLRVIYRFTEKEKLPLLSHIEKQCGSLEILFPYSMFLSVGILNEEVECSICGKSIDSFDCEHIAGELYRGKMARGIVKKIKEVDHVSLVTNPADKRCTVQVLDNAPEFNGVKYLANSIGKRELEPLCFDHVEISKRRILNDKIPTVGRNEPCPCGSGKKFKKCCINQRYVEKDHAEIIIGNIAVAELFNRELFCSTR